MAIRALLSRFFPFTFEPTKAGALMLVRMAGAAALAGVIAFALAGAGAAGDGVGVRSAFAPAGLPSEAMMMAPVYNTEAARAPAPMGWVGFCERYRDECRRETYDAQPIVFDPAARDLIHRVNARVRSRQPARRREAVERLALPIRQAPVAAGPQRMGRHR